MSTFWGYGNRMSDPMPAAGMSSGARSAARQALETARELEERVDKLTLICMAMWELLREKGRMQETDLLAKVQELDLRDGIPDGKITRSVSECPKCGRTMSPRHQRCLYCGYENLTASAFDGV